MSDQTGLLQGSALVRPYVLASAAGDPGPVPQVVEPEPDPGGMVLIVDGHTRVEVTGNIGRTGLTGLTVTRGEASVTVALQPPTVDALRQALAEAAPIPYQPTTPHTATGGGRR